MVVTSVSIHRQMDKDTHTYTHKHTMEYYSAIKEWNFAICSNIDGLRGHYGTEVSQTVKANYYMISLICGI